MNQQRETHDSEAGVQVFDVRMTIGPPGPGMKEATREAAASSLKLGTVRESLSHALNADVSLEMAEPGPAADPGILDKIERTGRELSAELRALAGRFREQEEAMARGVPPVADLLAVARQAQAVRVDAFTDGIGKLLGTGETPGREKPRPVDTSAIVAAVDGLKWLGGLLSDGAFSEAMDWAAGSADALVARARKALGETPQSEKPAVATPSDAPAPASFTERIVVQVQGPGYIEADPLSLVVQLQRQVMMGMEDAEKEKRRAAVEGARDFVSRCIAEGLGQEYIQCDGCGEWVRNRDCVDFMRDKETLKSHCPTCAEKLGAEA